MKHNTFRGGVYKLDELVHNVSYVSSKKQSFWSTKQYPGLHKNTYMVDSDVWVDGLLLNLSDKPSKRSFVGVDLETTGLDPQIKPIRTRLITLENRDIVAVFDLFKLSRVAVDRIMRWLEDPRRVKIFHNGKFDLKFLMWEFGCADLYPLFDTQLAAQLVDLGDRYGKHDLGYCVQHYLGVPLDKDIRHGWTGELTPAQKIYASNDTARLRDLRVALLEICKERGLLRKLKLEFEAVVPTARMELNGFKLDEEKWNAITSKTREKLFQVQDRLMELLPPVRGDTPGLFDGISHFNANSDEVMKERLKAIGIILPKITEQGDDGGDVERDTLLSDKMAQIADQHAVIPLVIEYGMLSTAVASYGKKFLRYINPHDHRLHADFRQIGTVTTRYTVKQPPLHGIPKKSDHRECFISEPGWKLVWADYSQIELRILAELSGDENMLKAFLENLDLHTQTASLLFGISYELVEEIQRRRAKDLNFGIPYGVGPKRFAERAGISLEAAKKMMGDHARKYPQSNTHLKNAAARARVNGWCETMSGAIITFKFDRNVPKQVAAVERHGKNYPIQGSSADITKTALRMVHDDMDHDNAKLVNCVHDEIVLEVRDDYVEVEAAKLRAAMVRAGEEFLKTVPVIVDVEVNNFWRKKRAA